MSKAAKLVLVVVCTSQASAQTPEPGAGAPIRPQLISRSEAIIAVAAVTTAALLDGTIRTEAQNHRSGGRNGLASFGNTFGTLIYVGPMLVTTWASGKITGQHGLARASVTAGAAGIVAGGITGFLKLGFGRVRPRDGGDPDVFRPFTQNASFPSGHTTVAFAVATSLAQSTRDGWSDVLFYGIAGMTGLARINDDKHWLSDVVAGGTIGYLVGRQLNHRPGRIRAGVGPGSAGLTIAF